MLLREGIAELQGLYMCSRWAELHNNGIQLRFATLFQASEGLGIEEWKGASALGSHPGLHSLLVLDCSGSKVEVVVCGRLAHRFIDSRSRTGQARIPGNKSEGPTHRLGVISCNSGRCATEHAVEIQSFQATRWT